MNIELNIDPWGLWENLIDFWLRDPITIAVDIFLNGGWIVFVIALIIGLYLFWLSMRQKKFAGKWEYVILAIDIPKNNEQSPKAVENIFVALAATQSNGNLIDRYWSGKIQESFSFEIVSLEGYIQFLVRTPAHFRDLIEASIYAQYPDAEIHEVDDYAVRFAEIKFPNNRYNLWGTDFVLVKDYPYPIRTYTDFLNPFTRAVVPGTMPVSNFLDPMAALLEIMGRFGPKEQAWIQLIVTPMPPGWDSKANRVIKELMGEKYVAPESASVKVISKVLKVLSDTGDLITQAIAPNLTGRDSSTEDTKDARMTMVEIDALKGVQAKLAKHGMNLKFRFIYLAEHDVFDKGKGVAGVIGAIQQFNTNNANGFKPGSRSKTSADYFRVKQRVAKKQNKILENYINRSTTKGDEIYNMMFSTEELASLWHFPVVSVKASAMEKIASKKVVPPTRLPFEERNIIGDNTSIVSDDFDVNTDDITPQPPDNLPIS